MTSIIENELLRELIGLAQSHADRLAARQQTKGIKLALADTHRVLAEASKCLPETPPNRRLT